MGHSERNFQLPKLEYFEQQKNNNDSICNIIITCNITLQWRCGRNGPNQVTKVNMY